MCQAEYVTPTWREGDYGRTCPRVPSFARAHSCGRYDERGGRAWKSRNVRGIPTFPPPRRRREINLNRTFHLLQKADLLIC